MSATAEVEARPWYGPQGPWWVWQGACALIAILASVGGLASLDDPSPDVSGGRGGFIVATVAGAVAVGALVAQRRGFRRFLLIVPVAITGGLVFSDMFHKVAPGGFVDAPTIAFMVVAGPMLGALAVAGVFCIVSRRVAAWWLSAAVAGIAAAIALASLLVLRDIDGIAAHIAAVYAEPCDFLCF